MKHLIFLTFSTLVVSVFAQDGICDTKDQYINELTKIMDQCGIAYFKEGDTFTVDKTKACVDSCRERAVELEKICDQTNIGGDGDSIIIQLISDNCKISDNPASKVTPLLFLSFILKFFFV